MRKTAGVACMLGLVTLAVVLGTAASSGGAAPPPNPPPCQPPDYPTFPCVPPPLDEKLSGKFSFVVPLSAATQDATGLKGDPGGAGSSSITLDLTNNKVCATTSWSGIDSPVVAAHIHGGAYGQPENPAVTISLFNPDFVNGVASPAHGCATVPAPELWAINKCRKQFNVVVHSQQHPWAAIRGQLGTTCNL